MKKKLTHMGYPTHSREISKEEFLLHSCEVNSYERERRKKRV
jgi:hypothetical protein